MTLPKKPESDVLHTRVDIALLRRIVDAARQDERSVSNWIALTLRRVLDAQEKK